MTSKWLARALLGAFLLSAGCGKDKGSETKAPAADPAKTAAPAAPAGARRIPIEVKRAGYVPNRVEAKAGEDLVLVFTRTEEGSCGEEIQIQGTDLKASLPLNQPVELPVKAPASGELVFACGMDMMHGIVAVSES